jgi:hypothetical protein
MSIIRGEKSILDMALTGLNNYHSTKLKLQKKGILCLGYFFSR